jgi:cytochrome P450
MQSVAMVPIPAAPVPHPKRLTLLRAVRALRTNPITVFAEAAFEEPTLELDRRGKTLLVSDPSLIEHVLIGNASNYCKSVQQQRRLEPALGNGLLTAEGEDWRSTRRIASPLFSPKAVEGLFEDMQAASAEMCARWSGLLDRPIDIAAEFQRLTYEIISRTVFSGALDADRVRIHASMALYFETIGRVDLGTIFNLPAWLSFVARHRAKPALGLFRGVVDQVVASRMANGANEPPDLLDRLMRAMDPASGTTLGPDAVADNVLTFLAAGHETTGNALAWTLYLLALFPEWERAVLEEIQTVCADGSVSRDCLGQLVYTTAVVKEAMRLYPPAPFIGRQALGEDALDGKPVREGTQIVIAPWVVHRHRRLWQDPDRFSPDRFLPEHADAIPRGAFIPFGLGPRICIGQGLAMQEIAVVLATILPKFSFALAHPQDVFPLARITLRPARGVTMTIHERPERTPRIRDLSSAPAPKRASQFATGRKRQPVVGKLSGFTG